MFRFQNVNEVRLSSPGGRPICLSLNLSRGTLRESTVRIRSLFRKGNLQGQRRQHTGLWWYRYCYFTATHQDPTCWNRYRCKSMYSHVLFNCNQTKKLHKRDHCWGLQQFALNFSTIFNTLLGNLVRSIKILILSNYKIL